MREGLVVASWGLYFPIAAYNQCCVRRREIVRWGFGLWIRGADMAGCGLHAKSPRRED